MNLTDVENKWLQEASKSATEAIGKSAHFLSLYSGSYSKDAGCALQLGLAILMDKPLYFLVEEGVVMPKNLQRAASGIEHYKKGDSASLEAATMRLLGHVVLDRV